MDYATVADMLTLFGERELIDLSDRDENAALVPARIERALSDAQAFADGLLSRAYRLPLTGCAKPRVTPDAPIEYVPPRQLTRIVCDVARYYLHENLAPEHEVYRRFKAAQGELQAIASGSALLACPWGGEAGERLAGEAVRWHFSPREITGDISGSYA